jgi:hypothetical protein
LLSEGGGGRLRGSHLDLGVRITRIHEISYGGGLRNDFVQQLQSFGHGAPPNMVMLVALPPGRLRLATTPSLTGSPFAINTIGIVRVAGGATKQSEEENVMVLLFEARG